MNYNVDRFILFVNYLLLVVKRSYDPVCPSIGPVGRFVCHNFLTDGKFYFHASFRALVSLPPPCNCNSTQKETQFNRREPTSMITLSILRPSVVCASVITVFFLTERLSLLEENVWILFYFDEVTDEFVSFPTTTIRYMLYLVFQCIWILKTSGRDKMEKKVYIWRSGLRWTLYFRLLLQTPRPE